MLMAVDAAHKNESGPDAYMHPTPIDDSAM